MFPARRELARSWLHRTYVLVVAGHLARADVPDEVGAAVGSWLAPLVDSAPGPD